MTFLLVALFTIVHETTVIVWHEFRERGSRPTLMGVSVFLELIQLLPIWFAVQADDWRLLIAAAVGSGIGALTGLSVRDRIRRALSNH